MTRKHIYTTKSAVSQNEKRLIYGIGGLILFVFAFVFIIAPYEPPSKKDGENYLEHNKLKRRVKILPSGLQYKVLSKFSYVDNSLQRKPLPSSKIRVKYEGRLVDGVVFDKNDNAVFEMKKVIVGWQEGLQLMSEGDIFEFYIPSNLAYGEKKRSAFIVENSALVFKIELLEILEY